MADPVKIKICGVRDAKIAGAAVEAGADMVGVVFVERSARHVTVAEAAAVAHAVEGRADVVGLFVDGTPAKMKYCAAEASLTMLQLYGEVADTSAERLDPMRAIVAQAFEPGTFAEVLHHWDGLYRLTAHPHALLIDTPDPSEIGGGTGQSFDWSSLRERLDEAQPKVPIVLAGGLTPDNVADAIRTVQPWMVDVSSGVESERGVKDAGRVRAFCEAARSVGMK